jgi:hypothetical protein
VGSQHRVGRRRLVAGWVHVGAFAAWVITWVVGILANGGRTRIVADTPLELAGLAVLFVSCFAIVGSAVVGRLEAGGTRATFGPLMTALAMLGGLVPSAIRAIRSQGRSA